MRAPIFGQTYALDLPGVTALEWDCVQNDAVCALELISKQFDPKQIFRSRVGDD